MSKKTLEAAADRIDKRAEALRAYAAAPQTQRKLGSELNRTRAALLGCADYARELGGAAIHYQDRIVAEAQQAKQQGKASGLVPGTVINYATVRTLTETLALIANEKDGEALRELAKQAGEAGVKILMSISHADVVVHLKEVLEASVDLYRTGQTVKFRENQVALASDLLQWLETTTLACMNWCAAAQQYLLAVAGHGVVSDDELLKLVNERLAATWKKHAA